MSSRRIARAALRCYPPATRAARGAEMLDTLLDAAEDRRGAFVRDLVSLVIAGLGERARVSARTSGAATVADAAKLASILSACLWLTLLIDRLGWLPAGHDLFDTVGLLAVLLAWVLGRQRFAGVLGVACTVLLLVRGPAAVVIVPAIAVVIVPAIGYVFMLIAPTRKRPHPLAVIGLAGLVLLSVIVSPQRPGAFSSVIVLAAVSLAGVLAFPIQPRLAIASAIIWTAVGVHLSAHAGASGAGLIFLVAAAPAVLVVSAARAQLIRRRAR